MRRRIFLAGAVGVLGAAGCVGSSDDDVDLRIENTAGRPQSMRVEVGGKVKPRGAVPPEGQTVTYVGADETYLDGTVTVDPDEVHWERGVIEEPPHWRRTGVSVDLEGGPERRVPIHPGPDNDGTIIGGLVGPDGFDISMRHRDG